MVIGYFTTKQILFFNQSKNLNLILISVDTLRPDHMGVYGYNKNTTPNIDKWAKDAMVFSNVRTIVPVTYPSFAALMTGSHSLDNKIINNQSLQLSRNTQTLAKMLKEKGFSTSAFITSEVLSQELTNMDNGFDTYRELKEKGDFEEFVNSALNALEKNNQGKKFFWIHFTNPHWPYEPTRDNKCRFGPQYCDIISEKGYIQLEEERKQMQAWGTDSCRQEEMPKQTKELYESLYDGEIADTDFYINKVLNTLKKTGLDKNSIVVFYADHGEGFDHNYYFTHGGVLYDSALKIPLIIKFPNTNKRGKTDVLIDNADIFTTLSKIYGLRIEAKNTIDFSEMFHSDFFSNLLISKKKYIISINEGWNRYSITDNKFKYILNNPQSCKLKGADEELYNLKADPKEALNILKKDPTRALYYKKLLLEHLSQYNLPQFTNVNSSEIKGTEDLEKLKSLGY